MRDALEDASCFKDCDRHIDLAGWNCNHFEICLRLDLDDFRSGSYCLRSGRLNREQGTELAPVMKSNLTPELDRVCTVIVSDLATVNLRATPVGVTLALSTPLVGLGAGIVAGDELPEMSSSGRPA